VSGWRGFPRVKLLFLAPSYKAKTAAVPRHFKWCCCCYSHFLAIILHMLNFIFSFSPGFHLARCIKIIKFCSIFLFLFFLEPNLQGLGVILQLAPAIYGLVQLFNSPHKYGAHAYEFKYDFISCLWLLLHCLSWLFYVV